MTISYQALVLGSDGKPIEAEKAPVSLALVDASTGATVWSDAVEADIHDGVLNLALGSHTPLPSPQSLDRPLKLQIGLRGSPPITTDLTASPYALNVADSSITASKMAADYVSVVTIEGQRVTSKGGPLNLQAGEGLQLSYNEEANAVTIGIPKSQVVLSGGSASATNLCTSNTDGGEGTNTVVGGCTNIIDPVGLSVTPTKYATIAGGQYNTILAPTTTDGASWSTIAGGRGNVIGKSQHDAAMWSFIGAGDTNKILDYAGFIGSGKHNVVSEEYSAVVNGLRDEIYGLESFIGSGEDNIIGNAADEEYVLGNAIVTGQSNHIDANQLTQWNFIGAGRKNIVNGPVNLSSILGGDTNTLDRDDYSAIAAGRGNKIDGSVNASVGGFIGGGTHNTITSSIGVHSNSVISGGAYNNAESELTFVGGGEHNRSSGTHGTVVGGSTNTVSSSAIFGTVVGGQLNTVDQEYGFVGGGSLNITKESHGFVGGGTLNEAGDAYATIGGGDSNRIADNAGARSFIGGGDTNLVLSQLTVIGGGAHNTVYSMAPYSVIGGGRQNRIEGRLSVIAGGDSNKITDVAADHNFIGGGQNNIEDNPSFGVIGGGQNNLLGVNAWASTIGGGWNDTILVSRSFVGGGERNTVQQYDDHSGIVSGEANQVWAAHAFIGAGQNNLVHGLWSSIVGGLNDTVHSGYSFMGGGESNLIAYGSEHSVMGGGHSNFINVSDAGTMAGGIEDSLLADYGFMGGGAQNKVDYGAPFGVEVGGDSNTVQDNLGFIGGGCHNRVTNAVWGTIVAGCTNLVLDSLSFIGGGSHNTIDAPFSTLLGGTENTISRLPGNGTKAQFGSVGGGFGNSIGPVQPWLVPTLSPSYELPWAASITGGLQDTAAGHFSTVGGGFLNNASGLFSSTIGGTGLLAFDFQTVVGRFNDNIPAASGLVNLTGVHLEAPARTDIGSLANEATLLNPEDPIFIVGNGGLGLDKSLNVVEKRSNAFEVSDDGHSIVFDQLTSSPTARTAVFGATYNDNIVYAWGDVPTGPPGTFVATNNFGVSSVFVQGGGAIGVYVVTLQAGHTFTDASITVTVQDNALPEQTGTCGYATASKIGIPGPNQFVVRTYSGVTGGACDRAPLPFFFKVTGR